MLYILGYDVLGVDQVDVVVDKNFEGHQKKSE